MNKQNGQAAQKNGGDAGYAGRRQITVHLIAVVLLVVLARSGYLAFAHEGQQPDAVVSKSAPRTPFELFDRHGQALALSIECFDLSVSPQSLWRSHTPDHLAAEMAGVLGVDPVELLLKLLPEGAAENDGLLVPEGPRLLRFHSLQVPRVQEWLERGGLDPEAESKPLLGFTWHLLEDPRFATLAWDPVVVLGRAERVRHLGKAAEGRPDRWTTRLLSDLGKLVTEFGLPADIAEDMRRMPAYEKRAYLADRIWKELCPSAFRVVQKSVPPDRAHELAELFRVETVSPWQIQLTPSLRRFQPVRQPDLKNLAMGEADVLSEDAFGILGHWGVLGAEDALVQARIERETAPHRLPWDGAADPVQARARELANQWKPWSGLERLCATLLDQSGLDREWNLDARGSKTKKRRVARDRRKRWEDRRVPDYLQEIHGADGMVELHASLDARLQVQLHAELLAVMEEHDPALAMGICVEVETGKVLAVDGIQNYPGGRFLPTQHVFTPGSTFKALIMAAALDRGLVQPEEQIKTFYPKGFVVRQGRSARLIREAEGSPSRATISAREGLAHSVNAVLVQIGLRMDAADLRSWLESMGYGAKPRVGIGPERLGHLRELDKGTWSRLNTHASVCFGHEIGVTLWQHAQGLATLARGGGFLPLRLVDAVSQGNDWRDFVAQEPRRVLAEETCVTVMEMLAMGAREGTGRRVAGPEDCPEFHYIGTKTGTTEKVVSEICLHVELQHMAQHTEDKTECSKVCYQSMKGARDHKGPRKTCYTSSMCAIGQVEPGEPHYLTLIVVDDPRSKAKFGGEVAGKSAVRMLRLAAGLSEEYREVLPPKLPELSDGAFGTYEMPWLDEGDAAWSASMGYDEDGEYRGD